MSKLKKIIKSNQKLYALCCQLHRRYSRLKAKTPQQKAYWKFIDARGDEVLRLSYELNENSVVFDLGGYKGEWTEKIYEKYGSNIYIFEPVIEFYEKLENKFAGKDKIKTYNSGLDGENSSQQIIVAADGSSAFRNSTDVSQKISTMKLKRADTFFLDNKITEIDLMKINIEGGEYSLLEHLIETENIGMIKNVQIQFHDIKSINSAERMKNIQKNLSKTHELQWQFFPYIWESWKLKY